MLLQFFKWPASKNYIAQNIAAQVATVPPAMHFTSEEKYQPTGRYGRKQSYERNDAWELMDTSSSRKSHDYEQHSGSRESRCVTQTL